MIRSKATTDQQYLSRMAELSRTHPEYRRLRNLVVELHLPLAVQIARRFRNRGEPIQDLVQVASAALIKSVDSYDINRGVAFASYAVPRIVGELKHYLRDSSRNVRPPRDLQELSVKIQIVIEELGQRLRRSPTLADLATHLRLTEKQVLAGLRAGSGRTMLPLDAAARGHEFRAT